MSLLPETNPTGTTKEQRLKLRDALDKAGVFHFRQNSSYKPKYSAQNALAGKSHYVDDGTLRYFNAKVLDAGPILDGLFYYIRESKEHSNGFDRVHDYKYFDIFGNTVREMDKKSERDECYTSAQLAKSEQRWFDVNPIEYYSKKLAERKMRKQAEVAKYETAIDSCIDIFHGMKPKKEKSALEVYYGSEVTS